ncbi:hypothetical protein FKM82_019225 [Ascaphus truei]
MHSYYILTIVFKPPPLMYFSVWWGDNAGSVSNIFPSLTPKDDAAVSMTTNLACKQPFLAWSPSRHFRFSISGFVTSGQRSRSCE